MLVFSGVSSSGTSPVPLGSTTRVCSIQAERQLATATRALSLVASSEDGTVAKAGPASPVQQGQAIKERTFPLVTVSRLFNMTQNIQAARQKQAVSKYTDDSIDRLGWKSVAGMDSLTSPGQA